MEPKCSSMAYVSGFERHLVSHPGGPSQVSSDVGPCQDPAGIVDLRCLAAGKDSLSSKGFFLQNILSKPEARIASEGRHEIRVTRTLYGGDGEGSLSSQHAARRRIVWKSPIVMVPNHFFIWSLFGGDSWNANCCKNARNTAATKRPRGWDGESTSDRPVLLGGAGREGVQRQYSSGSTAVFPRAAADTTSDGLRLGRNGDAWRRID